MQLRVAAQQLLSAAWPISDDEDVLTFFEPLKSHGYERGIDDDGVNHHGIMFWVNAISTIDYAHLPLELREYAVLRLLNIRRSARFEALEVLHDSWLGNVGNVHTEARGVHQRGDFWTLLEQWQDNMRASEDEYCSLSSAELREVSREELQVIIQIREDEMQSVEEYSESEY